MHLTEKIEPQYDESLFKDKVKGFSFMRNDS